MSGTCLWASYSLQSCLTLGHPGDCSPPGSSVHGVLQARILEWVAMPSSRGSFPPESLMSPDWQTGSLSPVPPGKPCLIYTYHEYIYAQTCTILLRPDVEEYGPPFFIWLMLFVFSSTVFNPACCLLKSFFHTM